MMSFSRTCRVCALLFLTMLFVSAQAAAGDVWKVLGQPKAVGDIQTADEAPFFKNLASTARLPVQVIYTPQDQAGIDEDKALMALRGGQVKIASLRISAIGKFDPAVLRLDLVGMDLDGAKRRSAVETWVPAVDSWLQKYREVKLLGVWPTGAQIVYCKKPIPGLIALNHKKVRVYDDPDLAAVIRFLGAIPVPLATREVQKALADGRVDCAIGSATTAEKEHWPTVTDRIMPIVFQLGINAYGINLSTWKGLDAGRQASLKRAFAVLDDRIWAHSERLDKQAIDCQSGRQNSCVSGEMHSLKIVQLRKSDIAMLQKVFRDTTLSRWRRRCRLLDPDCRALSAAK